MNSIFADCFGDWFIGIPFVGDVVARLSVSVSCIRYSKWCKFRPKMRQNALGLRPDPLGELERSPRPHSRNWGSAYF